MKRRAPFRQVDVARAVRGVLATGAGVSRVEIEADGKIVIFTGSPISARQAEEDELDRELEEWKKKHGYD